MSELSPENPSDNSVDLATAHFRLVNQEIGGLILSGVAHDDPRFERLNQRLDEAAAALAQERKQAETPTEGLSTPKRLLARGAILFGYAYADPASAQYISEATRVLDQDQDTK